MCLPQLGRIILDGRDRGWIILSSAENAELSEALRRQSDRDVTFMLAVLQAEHEASPDGILVVDEGGHIVSFNRRFIEMWDVPADLIAVRGDSAVLRFVTTKVADPDGFAAQVKNLYRHPQDSSIDEIALKDGRIFQRHTSPMKYADRYLGRVWYFRDVTAYVVLERKNGEADAQFSALAEQRLVGVVIISEGKFSYVNSVVCEMSGFTREEMVGHTAMDFVAAQSKGSVARHLEDINSGIPNADRLTASLLRKNGSIFCCLLQGTLAFYEGKPALFGVTLDISDQERARQDLEDANTRLLAEAARMRALVEQDLAGVFILRPDGKIVFVNARFAAMLGYSQDEVIGHPVSDYLDGAALGPLMEGIRDMASGKKTSVKLAAIIHHRNGSRMSFLSEGALANYDGSPAVVGVALDISEMEAAQATLQRLNRVLRTLSAGNTALVRANTETELLKGMCRAVIEFGGYKFAWIGFARKDQAKSVEPVGWPDHSEDYVKTLAITWGEAGRGLGPTGAAIRTGHPSIIPDIATEPSVAFWKEDALARGYRSAGSFPLQDGAETFGSLTIYAAEPDAFNADEVRLLTELAVDLSYGIVALRARVAEEEATQRLRRSLQSTVQAIASTLELRDPYTAGHQRAVAKLAVAIAGEIGVPAGDIEGIYLAGVVHDIGKIQIPAEILSKPGALSKLEFQMVQTHAQAGYDIIKGVEFPWPVANMILQHHERLDGSGYPNGLKDDQILIGAKIIAIADVVQAMTAHRPYRAALGLDMALAEIEKGKGTKYYPPAVDACVRLFRSKGFEFEPGTAA
jgi:PAS domain S-box-containing protein